MSKILIKNGSIISMDPDVKNLTNGDLLIEDDLIVDIGPQLSVEDAEIIDASSMIVMPGLINAHIHLWQTALRGVGGDWAGSDYYNYLHANLATRYSAEDTYIATLIGCLNQLDMGSTTVFDWCHNNSTPDHTDAGVDGLAASGVRAVFGHGTIKPKPKEGEPHFSTIPHPVSEIERLRKGRFSSNDSLLTLAMCILGPDYSTLDVNLHDFRAARELDLLSSAHVWGRDNRLVAEGYRRIAKEGLLGPDHNIAHANYMEDDEIQVIVDSGATITSTSPVEIRTHTREPVIGRVLAAGGKPSIGVDSEVVVTGDMFNTMRVAISVQRIFNNLRTAERIKNNEDPDGAKYAEENLKQIGTGGSIVKEISVRAQEALEWATINNARALRMDHKIGSLKPGKQADVILVRVDDLNNLPVNDPIQTIVFQANGSNVDTVFVNGKKMKEHGKLLTDELNLEKLKVRLIESKQRLFEEAGL